MPTQEEFEEKVKRFRVIEDMRSEFYNSALQLLNQGHEIEAYILILATWNFAHYCRILCPEHGHRDIGESLNEFKCAIREVNPIFERLKRNKKFKDADFEDPQLCKDIKKIYEKLKEVVIVKQTGASKIMHLKNPYLFVMWDRKIREMYEIGDEANPEDYISFLKKIKRKFENITWENKGQTLAKAIDEYNYVESQE